MFQMNPKLEAELKMRRIMRHLDGSARRLQPLSSGMLQTSAGMTIPMAGHQGGPHRSARSLNNP